MSDEFLGIEKLLGLPRGSTTTESVDKKELVANGVIKKTNALAREAKKLAVLEKVPSGNLVKMGITIEELEEDKVTLRREAFEVYSIAKKLLEKFYDDIKDVVNVNPPMYLAGGKLIDSVTGSLDRLNNMVLKYKQEEEMKRIPLAGNEQGDNKPMSTEDWINYAEHVREAGSQAPPS